MKDLKNKNAITLLALIIAVIVLLILATVSISLVINSGILDHAQQGVNRYSEEEELEQIKLAVASAQLKSNGFLTTENLNSEFQERFGEKATESSKGWRYKAYNIKENGEVIKSLLPAEYQQVEYIESTGTQYIDTEFYPHSGKYIMEAKIKSVNVPTDTTYYRIFGNLPLTNAQTTSIYRMQYKGYNTAWDSPTIAPVCGGAVNKEKPTTKWLDNTEYVLIINGIKDSYMYVEPEYDNSTSIFLFNSGIASSNNSSMKYYYFNITNEDGNIIKNIIPVERIEDGKLGMYDTVEGKFYVNKGTGTFLKGNDV